MPNNKNYYVEVNSLAAILVAYFYWESKSKENNNFYAHPINASINWMGLVSSATFFFLSLITSAILYFNPGRSNFHLSSSQKVWDTLTKFGPGIIAMAASAGCKLTKTIAGERGDSINKAAVEAVSVIQQASRFLDKLQEMNAHKFARAIKNEETGEYRIRLIELKAQYLDEKWIEGVEFSIALIWRLALSGLLPRYFPTIDDENKLKILATLYVIADVVEDLGTKTINNLALATEIVVDNKYISKLLKLSKIAGVEEHKVEQPAIVRSITSVVDKVRKKIAKAAKEFEHFIKDKCAINIQAKWRGFEAKKLYSKMKEDAKKALLKMQEDAQKALLEMEKSAIAIQAKFRGFEAKKLYSKMKEDAKKLLHIDNPKQTDVTDSDTHSSSVSKDTIHNQEKIIKPKKEGFFSKLFKHHDKEAVVIEDSEHNSNFISRLFGGHTNIKNAQKTSSSADTKKNVKTDSSIPKTDKACLNEQNTETYIKLTTKSVYEIALLLISLKIKMAEPKNEEREEYEKSKKQIEEIMANNKVQIQYEDYSRIIEKPSNKTQTQFFKEDGEIVDNILHLENMGLLLTASGDEMNIFNQNPLVFAI